MTRHQLDKALERGQPGSLERLAYFMDISLRGPSDKHAHEALVEYLCVAEGMELQADEWDNA